MINMILWLKTKIKIKIHKSVTCKSDDGALNENEMFSVLLLSERTKELSILGH